MVTLDRGMGLLQATATNIIGMVGVGPFLTIPFTQVSSCLRRTASVSTACLSHGGGGSPLMRGSNLKTRDETVAPFFFVPVFFPAFFLVAMWPP